jgi:hypothetical protein
MYNLYTFRTPLLNEAGKNITLSQQKKGMESVACMQVKYKSFLDYLLLKYMSKQYQTLSFGAIL